MKTKILVLIIVVATIVLFIGGTFASSNKKAAAQGISSEKIPGYTLISSVPGAAFYVDSKFVDKATAITQISDNIGFQKNQYYSFKNGTDQYLLFNMSQLIIAAAKGTDFWLEDSSDKEYDLVNTNLMNIWFTQGSKKFSCETENGMTITKVCAGVSINSTTYGDFVGELANIHKDGEEWSIFVGVPGTRFDKISKDNQDGIDRIVKTLSFYDGEAEATNDIYAVSLSGDDASKQAVSTEVEVLEIDDNSLNLSNQNNIIDKDETMAYTSSPYNMLLLGDNGILSALNDNTLTYEEPIICPTKVYRGKEAEDLIMDYCMSTGDYAYFNAPDGSSWEVVEYDLNFKNCENDDYVNIKLKGLDGEMLKYRGIKYSARSYDMDYKAEEDGNWIRHMFTYYPVPNGCYEYCLECGERKAANNQEVSAAYYHIINEEAVHGELSKEESDEGASIASSEDGAALISIDDESAEAASSEDSSEESSESSSEKGSKESSQASSEASSTR